MSGHNKWSSIKHKKAITDAKRGKIFSRISREIIVAAKMGGGDPDMNPRLRTAVLKAREANMPKDNVEKSILKGTGELPGVIYEECVMEGYGPGGVAILIESLTDNKNRTTASLRSILNKNGGNPASAGSVSYIFEAKGVVNLETAKTTEEKVMEAVLDAGAQDIKTEGEHIQVWADLSSFEAVKKALEDAGIESASSELVKVPTNSVPLTDLDQVKKLLKLLDAIDDCEDVQNVYANFDASDELMAQAAE